MLRLCRDLGLSAMMNTNSFVDTIKGLGTLQWSAPEVLLGFAHVSRLLWLVFELCTAASSSRSREHH